MNERSLISKFAMPSNIETNKTKIVTAATDCFIAKGFHSTSMRDIANAAGVSLGNIYNHFSRKTDLILAISEEETAGVAEAGEYFATTKIDTLPAIHAFLTEYLKEASKAGIGVLMIEIAAEASRNKEVADAFHNNRKQLCQGISEFLQAGQIKGHINSEVNCGQAAELILDIVEGLATRTCLTGKAPSRAAVKEMNRLVERYLGV